MASKARVLLTATVTDVGEGPFVYPACEQCYSKLVVLRHQKNRHYQCQNCRYNHCRENYRYRLCLTVTDSTAVATVTAFGGMLNSFFGVTATEFHNIHMSEVREKYGTSCENIIQVAVEQAFVGQLLLFGLKITASDSRQIHVKQVGGYGVSLKNLCQNSCVSLQKSATRQLSEFIAVQVVRQTESAFGITVVECLLHLKILIEEHHLSQDVCSDRAALLHLLNSYPKHTSNDSFMPDILMRDTAVSVSASTEYDITLNSSFDQSSVGFSCDSSLEENSIHKNPDLTVCGHICPKVANTCFHSTDVSLVKENEFFEINHNENKSDVFHASHMDANKKSQRDKSGNVHLCDSFTHFEAVGSEDKENDGHELCIHFSRHFRNSSKYKIGQKISDIQRSGKIYDIQHFGKVSDIQNCRKVSDIQNCRKVSNIQNCRKVSDIQNGNGNLNFSAHKRDDTYFISQTSGDSCRYNRKSATNRPVLSQIKMRESTIGSLPHNACNRAQTSDTSYTCREISYDLDNSLNRQFGISRTVSVHSKDIARKDHGRTEPPTNSDVLDFSQETKHVTSAAPDIHYQVRTNFHKEMKVLEETLDNCDTGHIMGNADLIENYPESEGFDSFVSKFYSSCMKTGESIQYPSMKSEKITDNSDKNLAGCTPLRDLPYKDISPANDQEHYVKDRALIDTSVATDKLSPLPTTFVSVADGSEQTSSQNFRITGQQTLSLKVGNVKKLTPFKKIANVKKMTPFKKDENPKKQALSQYIQISKKINLSQNVNYKEEILTKQTLSQNIKNPKKIENQEKQTLCQNADNLKQQTLSQRFKNTKQQNASQNVKSPEKLACSQNVENSGKHNLKQNTKSGKLFLSCSFKNQNKRISFQNVNMTEQQTQSQNVKKPDRKTWSQSFKNSEKQISLTVKKPEKQNSHIVKNIEKQISRTVKIPEKQISHIDKNPEKQISQTVKNTEKKISHIGKILEKQISHPVKNSVKQISHTVNTPEKHILSYNVKNPEKQTLSQNVTHPKGKFHNLADNTPRASYSRKSTTINTDCHIPASVTLRRKRKYCTEEENTHNEDMSNEKLHCKNTGIRGLCERNITEPLHTSRTTLADSEGGNNSVTSLVDNGDKSELLFQYMDELSFINCDKMCQKKVTECNGDIVEVIKQNGETAVGTEQNGQIAVVVEQKGQTVNFMGEDREKVEVRVQNGKKVEVMEQDSDISANKMSPFLRKKPFVTSSTLPGLFKQVEVKEIELCATMNNDVFSGSYPENRTNVLQKYFSVDVLSDSVVHGLMQGETCSDISQSEKYTEHTAEVSEQKDHIIEQIGPVTQITEQNDRGKITEKNGVAIEMIGQNSLMTQITEQNDRGKITEKNGLAIEMIGQNSLMTQITEQNDRGKITEKNSVAIEMIGQNSLMTQITEQKYLKALVTEHDDYASVRDIDIHGKEQSTTQIQSPDYIVARSLQKSEESDSENWCHSPTPQKPKLVKSQAGKLLGCTLRQQKTSNKCMKILHYKEEATANTSSNCESPQFHREGSENLLSDSSCDLFTSQDESLLFMSKDAASDKCCQRTVCGIVQISPLLHLSHTASADLDRGYSEQPQGKSTSKQWTKKKVRFSNRHQEHLFFNFEIISHLPVVNKVRMDLKSSLKRNSINWECSGSQDLFSESSQDISGDTSLHMEPCVPSPSGKWNSSHDLFSQSPESVTLTMPKLPLVKHKHLTSTTQYLETGQVPAKTDSPKGHFCDKKTDICASPNDWSFELFTQSPINEAMRVNSSSSPAAGHYSVNACISPDLFA